MLTTNVLCMKKRKKRSYYVSNVSDYVGTKYNSKRSGHSGVGMMQITEDTPPDMLAGAMDLMVHLPDGKATKMAVERSTPMMDVLVQITNANHLQISGYVLQPLAINSDRILPYFPNTPIGTLDTQDIRVVAKNRGTSLQRTGAPVQPFETTFRLKVHLPRNQLYVERVSMQAHLHDIMQKMCEEKNLDRNKYEFRHPSNLDQVLDLKQRLGDYQITEVYAVSKGSNRLTQVFSSSDSIMAFRKEDDRRQKSGGGIFNFLKRGKVSNGSGSLSSDNRSISPTHSDDSRSVSPPVGGAKLPASPDKPKPPQRKRRPAPKPPSAHNLSTAADEKQNDDDGNGVQMRKKEGLTICHSRNSSDSSGYHEASILSDNANTSLPRKRPQTISTSNLTAMKPQSKSTSSLAFASRLKKKAAPPPPPAKKSARSDAHLENASPVVASPVNAAANPHEDGKQHEALKQTNTPCTRDDTPVVLDAEDEPEEFTNFFRAKNARSNDEEPAQDGGEDDDCADVSLAQRSRSVDQLNEEDYEVMFEALLKKSKSGSIFDDLDKMGLEGEDGTSVKSLSKEPGYADFDFSSLSEDSDVSDDDSAELPVPKRDFTLQTNLNPLCNLSGKQYDLSMKLKEEGCVIPKWTFVNVDFPREREYNSLSAIDETDENNSQSDVIKPKIVGVVLKKENLRKCSSTGDISKAPPTGEDLFTTLFLCSKYSLTTSADVNAKKNDETSPPESLVSSLSATLSSNIETDIGNIRDEITEESDESDLQSEQTIIPTKETCGKIEVHTSEIVVNTEEEAEGIVPPPPQEAYQHTHQEIIPDVMNHEETLENNEELDSKITLPPVMDTSDWEYQLPSPPTAFRDSSPHPDTSTSEESETISDIHPSTDSILTSPELFEKLHVIKESQSQISESDVLSTKSGDSEDNKFISKLSLENLEIRKKLVYNRELATSLKYQELDSDDVASKRSSVMSELEDVVKTSNGHNNVHSSVVSAENNKNNNWNKVKGAVENFSAASKADRVLPNFKISTYDIPKKKINIFEDDSIRSNVTVPVVSAINNVENEVENVEEVVEKEKLSFLRKSRPAAQEYNKNRCFTLNRQFLQRSESFNTWTPTAPVKRSKSQVALKQEVPEKTFNSNTLQDDNRSLSTLDLTGLQSIEVMKAIRTTLTTTTPTNTTSNTTTSRDEVDTSATSNQPPMEVIKPLPSAKQAMARPVSMFTTPSINFAPWKERKPTVEIKSTTAPSPKMNSVTSLNGNHKVTTETTPSAPSNVSIKVNGSEPISQQPTGNVLIKIGQPKLQDDVTKRYINHSTAVGYRRPLGNINKVQNMRPHSIAFDQFEKVEVDTSRVPIVRAVELKKHAHTNGTSVTQICPDAESGKVNLFGKVLLRSAAARKIPERPKSVNLTSNEDQRGLLLESIRNFGGKKGLKTVKV